MLFKNGIQVLLPNSETSMLFWRDFVTGSAKIITTHSQWRKIRRNLDIFIAGSGEWMDYLKMQE